MSDQEIEYIIKDRDDAFKEVKRLSGENGKLKFTVSILCDELESYLETFRRDRGLWSMTFSRTKQMVEDARGILE
jgi:N-glycosylase/DNA lyase